MVNTLEKENKKQAVEEAQSRISIREGYLPVPIAIISPARLAGKTLYCIDIDSNIQAYPDKDIDYGTIHRDFLLKKGVRYLYISISDFNDYLKAVSKDAEETITTEDLPLVEKCEFVYAVLLSLAKRLMSIDIKRETFVDVLKICKSVTPVFIKHSNIYRHFFASMLRDYDHAAHSANMSITLITFARKIGVLDKKILTHCLCGGILHDLGKRFIPSDILDNPGKLSELDLLIAQSHVLEGVKNIEKLSKLPSKVMNIVCEHHETIDGEGYPKGLAGKEISIYGKMACIVDMFEAMTCQRPYRQKAMTTEQAMAEIRGLVGLKLDKTIAGSFAQFINGEISGIAVSDDYFDGLILDDLGLTPEIGANPSGRRHERFYFRTKARLTTLTRKEDKWILADTKAMFCSNLSISGVAFLNDKPYEVNKMVRIDLEMPEDCDVKVQAIGKIVRCVDNGGGMYTIGIEFIKYMEESKVKEIHFLLK